ncbi:hypothetical protein BD408DRAFT_269946 [Parasitella parasitica]|nr:hypothetical protein BD408DRAFT_269946 [Parasitella parasitica]
MPIYKPPSLIRQNAFILEDDQTETPLDSVCRICYEIGADDNPLFQPCQCHSATYPTLYRYAHSKCFSRWLSEHGYPQQCTKCKSVYAKAPSTVILKNRRKYVISLIMSFIVLYSIYHLISSCSTFEEIPDTKLYADFGADTYNNVPEILYAPRISKSCIKSSIQIHCVSITMISILLFLFSIILFLH